MLSDRHCSLRNVTGQSLGISIILLLLNSLTGAAQDVNGDGRADLVWRNATNGGTMVWQMTAGALRGPITFPGGVPTNWEIQ